MRGLWNCVAQGWTPGIGDPDATGWLTVAAYLLCAGLAFAVWRRQPAGTSRGFWGVIAALTLFLAVNKQLDLQTAMTETGRCLSHAQGWYDQRRYVQLAFLALLVAGIVLAVRRGKRALSGNLGGNRLALWGVTILGGFVLMRAVGFHGVDRLIALRHTGVSMNYLLENAGLLLIAINAIAILRRGRADTAGPPDLGNDEGKPGHSGLRPSRPATRARR